MIRRLLLLFSFLNLDVVGGALAVSLWVQSLYAETYAAWYYWLGLGSALSAIYIIDRLFDVQDVALYQLATDRHRYYKMHFKGLIVVAGIFVVMGIVAALFMPVHLLFFGLALAVLSGLYLLLIHGIFPSQETWSGKELWVALVYSVGVFLSSMTEQLFALPWYIYLYTLSFMGTALLNLLMMSLMDKAADEQQGQQSFATVYGIKRSMWFMEGVFYLSSNLLLFTLIFAPHIQNLLMSLTLLAMNGLLYGLYLFRKKPFVRKNYRFLADGVFFLSLLGNLIYHLL